MDRRSDPVVGVLVRARERLETPEKWRQYDGYLIVPVPEDGDPTCLGVALGEVSGGEVCPVADAGALLKRVIGGHSIPAWNDAPERTHAEVLAALDRAIALRVEEIA